MPSNSKNIRMAAALLAASSALVVGGCSQRKVQASAPTAAAPAPETERPMTTAPDTDASPPLVAVTAAPTLPATATRPPEVAMPHTAPVPAPHKPATEQPNAEASAEPASHPPALQISPQLSPGDQANFERSTNDDLSISDRNLQQASGRQLSAAQQDLVEKIRSFTGQARDAGKGGDWTRAQNLAQKARLLSVELVNSL
jgi:hypothetical protein